jgi:hypothetical protein
LLDTALKFCAQAVTISGGVFVPVILAILMQLFFLVDKVETLIDKQAGVAAVVHGLIEAAPTASKQRAQVPVE